MTPCIEWTGARTRDGYGHRRIRDSSGSYRDWSTHRLVMAQLYGEEAIAGRVVMHTCDNKPCINPEHLRIGTVADNAADMRAKGRSLVGERQPASKLKEPEVRSIRERRSAGESLAALADEYGVSFGTISKISLKTRWRHIP